MFYTITNVHYLRMTHKKGSKYVKDLMFNCRNFILYYSAFVGIVMNFNKQCTDLNTITNKSHVQT